MAAAAALGFSVLPKQSSFTWKSQNCSAATCRYQSKHSLASIRFAGHLLPQLLACDPPSMHRWGSILGDWHRISSKKLSIVKLRAFDPCPELQGMRCLSDSFFSKDSNAGNLEPTREPRLRTVFVHGISGRFFLPL